MNKNEGKLEPVSSRLPSVAWSGILGQYAYWLTEPAALIDGKRLKHDFLAYWNLSLRRAGIACPAELLPAQEPIKAKLHSEPGLAPRRCVDGPRPSRDRHTQSTVHA